MTSLKPALFVVSPRLPRSAHDWRARFVVQHSLALAELGYPVHVLCAPDTPLPAPLQPVPMEGFGEAAFLEAYGAPEQLLRKPWRALPSALSYSLRLAKSVHDQRSQAQVLIAHWLLPGLLLARLWAGPALIYAHGSDVALLERAPTVGGQLLELPEAQQIVAVSEALAQRLGALGARAPSVLPMGVELPRSDPRFEAALRLRARGRPIVATVGRFVALKGLEDLLRALEPVAATTPLLWVAAGDGPLHETLVAQARARGVSLWTPGELGPRSRDALLAQATVFVQPSRALEGRTEGSPLALMEALASGTPSIVTATGGMPELLKTVGRAAIPPVAPGDVPALTRAVREALSWGPTLRAAYRNAHATAGAALVWRNLAPRHSALIDALPLGPPAL